jgi:hypothetical protein
MPSGALRGRSWSRIRGGGEWVDGTCLDLADTPPNDEQFGIAAGVGGGGEHERADGLVASSSLGGAACGAVQVALGGDGALALPRVGQLGEGGTCRVWIVGLGLGDGAVDVA